MVYNNSIDFARKLDAADSLAKYRNRFFIPRKNQHEVIYFSGNSLGLQSRDTFSYFEQELYDWAAMGVEGHFQAKNPWVSYHTLFAEPLARLTGAKPTEVVAMNSLSVNLHLLLVSFYRPTKKRFKILVEHNPFPSDWYAIQSQIRFHGFDPGDSIIEMQPRNGEKTLRTEDILHTIDRNKDSLALVLMGGVNYFTGQVFDMKAITEAASKAGALVGFDLAHAIGNIKLELHYWGVDFACWCSYKYLNSGPGSVGGIFIHEKHLSEKDLPRFNGWWGAEQPKKFLMNKEFSAATTAEAWQLSNAPIFSMTAHLAALGIFEEAGFDALLEKSKLLTGYLEFIINEINKQFNEKTCEIITPLEPDQRGCQISMVVQIKGKELHEQLMRAGVVSDWREPDVIRLAPVPLYNSFEDVFRFGEIMTGLLKK